MKRVHTLSDKCTRKTNILVSVRFRFLLTRLTRLTLFTLLLNTFTRSNESSSVQLSVGSRRRRRGRGTGWGRVNESANRNHGAISMISGSIPDWLSHWACLNRHFVTCSVCVSFKMKWNREKRHNNKNSRRGRKTNENWSKLSKIKAHN